LYGRKSTSPGAAILVTSGGHIFHGGDLPKASQSLSKRYRLDDVDSILWETRSSLANEAARMPAYDGQRHSEAGPFHR
jgi:hypothetical protein